MPKSAQGMSLAAYLDARRDVHFFAGTRDFYKKKVRGETVKTEYFTFYPNAGMYGRALGSAWSLPTGYRDSLPSVLESSGPITVRNLGPYDPKKYTRNGPQNISGTLYAILFECPTESKHPVEFCRFRIAAAGEDVALEESLIAAASAEPEEPPVDIDALTVEFKDSIVVGYQCPECEHIYEEEPEEDPLYECGNCGEFKKSESANDNHQCPQCNKFGSKIGAFSCEECGAGVDGWEEIPCLEVDGELKPLADLEPEDLEIARNQG